MKKKIALLILLILAVSAVLVACQNTTETKIIPRWEENEYYEFVISVADFAEAGDTRFVQYTNPDDNKTYYKDFNVRDGEPFSDLDEVRPTEASGLYTLKITLTDAKSTCTVETNQELHVTYKTEEVKDILEELKSRGLVDSTDSAENGLTTLKSTSVTKVVFKNDQAQAPISSETEVNGFYVGKLHQEASSYKVETSYDYSGSRTVVNIKLTDDEGKTSEISDKLGRGYTEGNFIDSNQLLMYVRSLDKSAYSFQDSPTISVYSPLDQQIKSASFVFVASANAVLTDSTRGEDDNVRYVQLPTVGVLIGGMPFMLQESLPDLSKQELDRTFFATTQYQKYTTVRFRSRYLSFELKSYNFNDDYQIWDALKPTVESAD